MNVLQEYPRPNLKRESYVNLNGYWQYAMTQSVQTPDSYDGDILVPFSPECKCSGVERQLAPDQWLHYRRSFSAPEGEGGRVLLHFGAVDHEASIFVNGISAGMHRGGYLPFSLDITDALSHGENILTVAVTDPSDTGEQARGKQKLARGGMFYTPQSGIWQTVWMERVPDNYIRRIQVTPCRSLDSVRVQIFADRAENARVEVWKEGKFVVSGCCDEGGEVTVFIPEDSRALWSPEHPNLYELKVSLPDGDRVESYFALRSFSVERDKKGILRMCLNGSPYLLNGLLDQGYWPESLYTPPSDEAMIYDIQTAKNLGFNLLRKHIKIEPERWYYHCDRLGMVVWQDMVNGGGKYPSWFLTYAINICPGLLRYWPDKNYRFFARTDAGERARYYEELGEMVEQLYNHPCIGAWVPFNEGWGQFDAPKATALVRSLDGTRLIDEASGWFDQRGGDFYSIHNYFFPLRISPQKDRIVALTEFGGISWPCPGHVTHEKTYGYGTAGSREEMSEKYRRLMEKKVLPNLSRGLSVLVYTQLSDVEEEVNGILTYDRQVIKVEEDVMRECARRLNEEFERCVGV